MSLRLWDETRTTILRWIEVEACIAKVDFCPIDTRCDWVIKSIGWRLVRLTYIRLWLLRAPDNEGTAELQRERRCSSLGRAQPTRFTRETLSNANSYKSYVCSSIDSHLRNCFRQPLSISVRATDRNMLYYAKGAIAKRALWLQLLAN